MTDRTSEKKATQTREEMERSWRSAAAGWARREPQMTSFMWPVAQAIIARAELTCTSRVLDVGCGIGNPGMQVAATVGPDGKVLSIDTSEEMLDTCRCRAKAYGLANMTFKRCSLEELDEPNSSFDAVVGQFIVNLLVDVPAGLRRIRELLKPGGRLCVAVWTPPNHNPVFAIPSRELRKVVELPRPERDAPGAYRLSADGELATVLAEAGLKGIRVDEVPLYQFGQTPDDSWRMLLDVSIFFRTQFDKLSQPEQRRVKEGFKRAVEQYREGDVIRVPALARVGSATKPECRPTIENTAQSSGTRTSTQTSR